MRILALDHGTRRIGVAVADTETGIAFTRPALRGRGLERDAEATVGLARDEGVELVVLGLPLNMDGSEGHQAALVRRFGERLAMAGVRIEYADERLSSWEAGERIAASGRRSTRRGGEIDSTAAQIVLQQYLDDRKEAG